MKLTIDRVPLGDLSDDAFDKLYLERERPVLITGVDVSRAAGLTFASFSAAFLPGAERKLAQYDAPLPADPTLLPAPFPELVRRVLARSDVAVRRKPMRIWAHRAGHYTLFHYDGNSLHSLNLQLQGHKRWRLVAPWTPLPPVPFGQASMAARSYALSPERHDFHELETHPGEMLFLPRYWAHDVESRGALNLNVNWVWTPRAPADSVVGRRESELLALRRRLRWLEHITHDSVDDYGGDRDVVRSYTADVPPHAVVLRLAKEVLAIPRFLMAARGFKARVDTLRDGNFNVDPPAA